MVKILFGWIIVGYVLEIVNEGNIVNYVYIFYIIFILEMRVNELMWKMWDEEVVGIINKNKFLIVEKVFVMCKVVELRCYVKGCYEVVILW